MGSNFEALAGHGEIKYEDELDTFADDNLSLKNALIIHNMTVLADCGITLDLNEAIGKFGNAIYEPKDFNCLRLDVRVKREYDAYSRLSNSKGFKDIESVSVVEATRLSNLPTRMRNAHFNNIESCSIHRGCYGDRAQTSSKNHFSRSSIPSIHPRYRRLYIAKGIGILEWKALGDWRS